jgi:hypothetical protein
MRAGLEAPPREAGGYIRPERPRRLRTPELAEGAR